MNKHFSIGCMWAAVAIVSFNDVRAAAIIGGVAAFVTLVVGTIGN